MFETNKLMTCGDKALIILILTISVGAIAFFYLFDSNLEGRYVVIRVENEIDKKISMEEDSKGKIYDFSFDDNIGYIEIKEEAVRMIEMNKTVCPESICSETGWINKEFETIVCLPNKISISIEGEHQEEIDMISY